MMAIILKIQQTVVDEYNDDGEYEDDDGNNVDNNVEGATHCGGGEQP